MVEKTKEQGSVLSPFASYLSKEGLDDDIHLQVDASAEEVCRYQDLRLALQHEYSTIIQRVDESRAGQLFKATHVTQGL